MFYYISGALALATPNTAVVDAGGIGYKLTISQTTYDALPPRRGENEKPFVKLFTYMSVREDGVELFGFKTETELASFKMLISVSGVGPKVALSVLSLLTPEKFALAVCTEDRKAIAKANGVGPKTAARIILELKDKMSKEVAVGDIPANEVTVQIATSDRGKLSEAQDALVVLGYSRQEALNVLKTIPTDKLSLEDIIKQALKKLM